MTFAECRRELDEILARANYCDCCERSDLTEADFARIAEIGSRLGQLREDTNSRDVLDKINAARDDIRKLVFS